MSVYERILRRELGRAVSDIDGDPAALAKILGRARPSRKRRLRDRLRWLRGWLSGPPWAD
jgi:hypothetical protein